MLPGCSPARRRRRTRQSMNTQKTSPTESRICQSRARSRYSKPCSPNQFEAVVLEHAVDAEVGADQRAEDDDRERAEQGEGELALVLRLAAGDHRRQEDPGGDERGRDPEDRELHVPGAHQVVGEDLGEVEAEEAVDARRGSAATRRRRTSGSGTAPPSRRRTRRSPAAPASARRRRARGTRASPARARASRACRPSGRRRAKSRPMPPSSAISESDRPDDHVRGRLVVDARLRRPVVRVRVVVPGPLGRRRPGRPGEEGGQLRAARSGR